MTAARAASAALAAALFALLILPLGALVLAALREPEAAAGVEVLGSAALWRHLWGSLRLGLATTFIAAVLGATYAFIVEGVQPPGRTLWRWLGLAPLGIPPYLLALALIEALGPKTGGGVLGDAIYSWPACALLLGSAAMPLVSLPLSDSLSRLDPALVDELRLRPGLLPRLRLLLAHSKAALLLGATLVFAYTLIDYSAPDLLRVDVLTRLVYARFAGFRDAPGALFAALPLLLLAAAPALIIGRGLSRRAQAAALPEAGFRWPVRAWTRRLACLALLALLGPALIMPAGVLIAAIMRAPEVTSIGLGALLSQALRVGRGDLVTSVTTALAAALIAWALAAALIGARVLPRLRGLGVMVLAGLAAVPGPIFGVGLVLLWDRPGEPFSTIYNSQAMLVLAALGRFLPLMILLTVAGDARRDPKGDEAARLAGRSPLALKRRVREQGALAAIVYALAAGEISAAILVAPPGATPLSATIMNMVHFGRTGELAALALLLLAAILIPSAVMIAAARPGARG